MRMRISTMHGKNLPDPLMPWDKKASYVFRIALEHGSPGFNEIEL